MKFQFTLLAIFLLALNAQSQLTYKNGYLSTGNKANDGTIAPSGYNWSELQNDSGNTTISNTYGGFGAYYTSNLQTADFTLSDNFIVPNSQQWNITGVSIYTYQTGYAGTSSPIDTLHFRIWNGPPDSSSSVIVFGDLTTNRLTSSADSLLYRIFNTTVPSPGVPATTQRKIWKITGSANVMLTPGNYWIEWQTHATNNQAHFDPAATVVGHRTLQGWNAKQHDLVAGTWSNIIDIGNPAPNPVAQDFPFEINYSLVLPVTFISFDGVLQNNTAVLSWSTANEINNKGFDVERSNDGVNFTYIGFVPGQGNSFNVNHYSYIDNKIISGSNYYRLKQIDLDGRYNYSSVIRLDFSKFDWAILGNPATNSSWIQLQLDRQANVSVQIVSSVGQIIQTINKGNIQRGTYSIPLNLNNVAPGMYIVRLMVDDKSYSKKVVR